VYYVRKRSFCEGINPSIDKDIYFSNEEIKNKKNLIFFNSQNIGEFKYKEMILEGENHIKNKKMIAISIPISNEKYWKIHQDKNSFLLLIPKTPDFLKDLIHSEFVFLPFVRSTYDLDDFDYWYFLYKNDRLRWTHKKEKIIELMEKEYQEYCNYLNSQKLNVNDLEIFVNFNKFDLMFTIEYKK